MQKKNDWENFNGTLMKCKCECFKMKLLLQSTNIIGQPQMQNANMKKTSKKMKLETQITITKLQKK
jgi:hypothetical protein